MLKRMLLSLVVILLLAVSPLAAREGTRPAAAQTSLPTVAIATFPAVGQAGLPVSFSGVGFTPNGIGQISGTFEMPSASALPGLTGNIVDISAVDRSTNGRTLPSHFEFSATAPADYDIANGHFFTQANGFPPGIHPNGYAVTNEQRFVVFVRFWDEFRRLGSVPLIGFPISQRFVLDGFETQAFQKAIFQWRPERDEVFFVNVLDVLHDRGFDDFLFVVRSTPHQLDPCFDAGAGGDRSSGTPQPQPGDPELLLLGGQSPSPLRPSHVARSGQRQPLRHQTPGGQFSSSGNSTFPGPSPGR